LICAAAQLNAQRVVALDFTSVPAINLISPAATNRINATVTVTPFVAAICDALTVTF
jgi:hypothetical protein